MYTLTENLISCMINYVFCIKIIPHLFYIFFFFNDTATTEIYTLSLHDALPISNIEHLLVTKPEVLPKVRGRNDLWPLSAEDRKSTRLNSSHLGISYAVFCLKKKIENGQNIK